MPDLESSSLRYKKILNTYFSHDEERAFFDVSELSKQLVQERQGPDILLEIHTACLEEMVHNLDPIAIGKVVVNANEILMNGMMAYAMSYYSFLDTLDREKVKAVESSKLLTAANARLLELDQLKSLFIASMSHELRTPLNSVIGFSSILLNEWIGALNDEQKKSLSSILRSGKHLLSLINDVIDISKVEAGMFDVSIDEFDLAELLAEVEQTFAKEALDRRLTLTVCELHVPMRTDRRRVLQCLLNLVSNALKYTEQGGVTVAVQPHKVLEAVTITVTDTGIGIGVADQEKLFKAFSRIQSLISTKVLGTGLGLYLTNKIVVEILEGTIGVTSELGSGSSFVMTIPSRLEGEILKSSPAPCGRGLGGGGGYCISLNPQLHPPLSPLPSREGR